MALDNTQISNYTDKTTIKNWFKTGLKPTQTQFWSTWDSFWHKSESLPISSISGLGTLIDGKAEIEHTHTQYATNDASSLTDDNVLSWQQKLGVDDLDYVEIPTENATENSHPYVVVINDEGKSAKRNANDFGKVDTVNEIEPDENKNVNIGLKEVLSIDNEDLSQSINVSTLKTTSNLEEDVYKNRPTSLTLGYSITGFTTIDDVKYTTDGSIIDFSDNRTGRSLMLVSDTLKYQNVTLILPTEKSGVLALTSDIKIKTINNQEPDAQGNVDISGVAMNWTNSSHRYSGILDKSADATFNNLLGVDSNGNLAKVNGKNVFINQPDNLTDAEKTAWKTKMNGGYTTLTTNVSIIIPNVIKKDVQVEKNIILRGSNLNINPVSFSISILNSSKTLIYTLNNSKVNLVTSSELNIWIDTSILPLNEELFVKVNNGVAEYITPISFQLRNVVDEIDFSVLTWTKHYKSDYVQSGIDYAEGINAGIEYNERTNSSLLGTSLVASLHSSNIPNLLATDNFTISFLTSLQNMSVYNGLDSVSPKVGIYVGNKPISLSNSISYGIYYNKTFSQSTLDSQVGMIGGSFDSVARISPVEALVIVSKQNSNLTVSISYAGNTKFLVSTFTFTPTDKIGFSLLLGGQLRRSNLSIKNIQGYKY